MFVVGREREGAAIGKFIASAVRYGDGIVVLGDPGVGELLQAASRQPRGGSS
jgi:hypothetical protein